ncbi:MAG: formylglycine-generating enzyme family protein [Proteobacteria bacterium]|nr:formylglycine-generating enzyme family protein [Pseudomonadota bacterium]
MHKRCRHLLLTLTVAAIAGCGRSPPPPAPTARTPAAAVAAVTPNPLDAKAVATQLAAEPSPPPVDLPHPGVEPLPPVVATARRKVVAALRQARLALDAGRIDERDLGVIDAASTTGAAPASPVVTPADALALYRGVLASEPRNTLAAKGIDDVLAALAARARSALAHEDVSDAQRDVDRIAALRGDFPGLAPLRDEMAKAWRVAGLNERGRRLEMTGAWIEPVTNNAAAAYRQALRLDPDSDAAKAGLDRVEGVFIARALAAANSAHYPDAEKALALALRVRAGSPTLDAARRSVLAIRQRHAQLLASQADAALDAGDADRAEPLLERIEFAMPGSPLIAKVRERIKNTRLYGRHLPGQVFSDGLSAGGRGPDMVVLPVGSFRMGSADSDAGHDANESPQRPITFAHGFAMARTDVTVEQYGRFVKATKYRTDAQRRGSSMVYDDSQGKLVARDGVDWRDDYLGNPAVPQMPVLHVSWNDAQAYTIWLSSQSARLYRLPSEAEFEYALRAGSTGVYPWPDTAPPKDIGNLAGNDPSPGGRKWGDKFADYADGYWGPAPVARFKANAFGLYDMVGNVAQWTQDCWHDNYRRAPADASAWVNPGCVERVVRGASWASAPTQARSAWRSRHGADESSARIGFRVVREL